MFYVLSNLAGMNIGDITIWEVGRWERLISQNFNV